MSARFVDPAAVGHRGVVITAVLVGIVAMVYESAAPSASESAA